MLVEVDAGRCAVIMLVSATAQNVGGSWVMKEARLFLSSHTTPVTQTSSPDLTTRLSSSAAVLSHALRPSRPFVVAAGILIAFGRLAVLLLSVSA